jgi:hypothetical protein
MRYAQHVPHIAVEEVLEGRGTVATRGIECAE